MFYSILICTLASAAGENVTDKSHLSLFCECSPCFEVYMYIQIKMLSLKSGVEIT